MGEFIRHMGIAEALLDNIREQMDKQQLEELKETEDMASEEPQEQSSNVTNGKGVGVEDLPGIIGSDEGEKQGQGIGPAKSPQGDGYNLYPSTHGGRCCNLAVFISLTSPAYTKGKGHLNFRQAIETIIQHCQGYCPKETKDAVFVTDSWDPSIVHQWRGNLERIQSRLHLEIYFIWVTQNRQSIHFLSF